MAEEVRIWQVLAGDRLQELRKVKLDLEERIEKWLEQDISIVADDLLVIGRQVTTDFGGTIDLVCLDRNGDVAIVELKRDKTPREITAQALDYASWIKDLSNERITEIAGKYLGDRGSLDQIFESKFGAELPGTLNQHHRMLVVASEIDGSTERIINYLSGTYGVDINAATFQYLRGEDGREYLARLFLIEPEQVEYSAQTKTASKRRHNLTYEELQAIADSKGIGELYKQLVEGLTPCFDAKGRTQTTIAFVGEMEGGTKTILSLVPGDSSAEKGVSFKVFINRLVKYLGADKESVRAAFPPGAEDTVFWKGADPGLAGFFRTSDEIERFVSRLRELRGK